MERIDIENARIRVEFLKNETNEVVKSEWFEYKVHGKTYWIKPDNSGIYWNGKKYRLEYIHEGTKGGIYI